MKKKKVLIIGAGPAGLAAGYKLLKEAGTDYEVIILEAGNEIGGISKTVDYKGNLMDTGPHRFFTKDPSVLAFWHEIMPLQGKPSFDDKLLGIEKNLAVDGPDPEKEDRVMLLRNRITRIFYNGKFFDYPISLKFNTLKNMGFTNTIIAGFSYLKSIVLKKKETNLENFFLNRFGRKLYSMFFESYTSKLWGRHPKNIDASWGVQRVKGISITAVLKNAFEKVLNIKGKTETSLIEYFYYPKHGSGHFYKTVAKAIETMGGKILFDHEVRGINCQKDSIVSVTCKNNNSETIIKNDYVLSSMPVKDLLASFNGHQKDKNVERIAEGLPYRDYFTVGLLLKELKLKNETSIKTINNIIPDDWVYIHDSRVKMIRFVIFNNFSPYMVKNINEQLWIAAEYVCDEKDELWQKNDDELKDFVINEFVLMDLIAKDSVIDTHIERVKKAYPAYFDTYDEFDKVIEYLNKFPNLLCIGRNGQHRYNNMDHSILSGFVAVDIITGKIKDKTSLWEVNTEKEYLEEEKKDA